jgi:broad specificity phosphatase PhoE
VTTPSVPNGHLVLVRHGETDWSRSGRHTGRTDIPLTADGRHQALTVRAALSPFTIVRALSSPLSRARETAELAGFAPEIDDDLLEWDYGGYEGETTAQIRERLGHDWTVFADGVAPGATPGETVEEVAARGSRVLARVLPDLVRGDVVLFGHGHALRILAAVFVRQEARFGASLLLDPTSVSVLQFEREVPAIGRWNDTTHIVPVEEH